MEIAPISGIRSVPMVKPSPAAPDLSRVFEAEYLGQSADDAYTPSHKRISRTLEDEDDDAELVDDCDEPTSRAIVPITKISYFA
ncbi:MAG TPA: hypothetical protein VGG85_09730 [Terracidiphilus sp.]